MLTVVIAGVVVAVLVLGRRQATPTPPGGLEPAPNDLATVSMLGQLGLFGASMGFRAAQAGADQARKGMAAAAARASNYADEYMSATQAAADSMRATQFGGGATRGSTRTAGVSGAMAQFLYMNTSAGAGRARSLADQGMREMQGTETAAALKEADRKAEARIEETKQAIKAEAESAVREQDAKGASVVRNVTRYL